MFLAAGLFSGFWWLFPPGSVRVRQTLQEAAAAASFAGNEGDLGRLIKASTLAALCTEGFHIRIDLLGGIMGQLDGRDRVRGAALEAAAVCGKVSFRILDAKVKWIRGTESSANFTLTMEGCGSRDFNAQEFQATLKKIGRRWLIDRIESVHVFEK
ncbi:MAG: hypothetical protein EXS36_00770 [Pedosphaera sp.]|nr:hypothetical protein [Pedosphaera sp.]